ncbi:MAG: hypothetical protein AAF412_13830, partial [Pseudomonadota bacterium]
LLLVVLMMRGHFVWSASTFKNLALIVIACAVMAGFLYGGQRLSGDLLTDANLLMRIVYIGLLVVGAMMVYFAIVIATGAIPKADLLRMFSRN